MKVLEVESVIVVCGNGSDKVIAKVANHNEAVFPYVDPLTMHFEAAKGTGAEWVRKNFCIEPLVVGDIHSD